MKHNTNCHLSQTFSLNFLNLKNLKKISKAYPVWYLQTHVLRTCQAIPLKLLPTLERVRLRGIWEPCQTSKMESFAEMVKPLIIIIHFFYTPLRANISYHYVITIVYWKHVHTPLTIQCTRNMKLKNWFINLVWPKCSICMPPEKVRKPLDFLLF